MTAKGNDKLPILYRFPSDIDSLITRYIETEAVHSKRKKRLFYYIVLSVEHDTTSIMLCDRSKAGSELESLLNRTNRIAEKKGIPVLLREDLIYNSEFNKVEYGKNGKVGITQSIFLLSGQWIKFFMLKHQPIIMKYEL